MNNELANWYKKLPKGFLKKYHNPNIASHQMKIPFRALIIGGSGSGKTQFLMDMISRMSGTFNLIILCVKSVDEPLYQYLISKVDPDMLHIYENSVPPLEEYKKFDGQCLVVFDDLVNEKRLQPLIQEWYLRGRKLAGGCSMVYLSQSYFKTPKFVRVNCNYIILKKLTSSRDLRLILGDYDLGSSGKKGLEQLNQIYEYAVSGNGALFIDIDAPPEGRFRRNFLEILSPEE
jgi:hypothetical protein